jgi:hypothetical protein
VQERGGLALVNQVVAVLADGGGLASRPRWEVRRGRPVEPVTWYPKTANPWLSACALPPLPRTPATPANQRGDQDDEPRGL